VRSGRPASAIGVEPGRGIANHGPARRRFAAAVVGVALALVLIGAASAQQPKPTQPAQPKPAAQPSLTPTAPPGFLAQPTPGQPGQPGLPAQPTEPLPTPLPTFTPIPSPTPPPTATPTQTPTRTVTPFPTYQPRATPTLAWPTPAPSAHFASRYVAMVADPSPVVPGAGALRGRVLDWRGIGQANFRVHAVGERMQAEGVTSADGQYTIPGLAPGAYEVSLADFRSEVARDVPVMAAQITTLDWIEALRGGVSAPANQPNLPVPTDTPRATATATPPPASLVDRPPVGPGRPSAPEVALLQVLTTAVEQLVTAFFTGVAVVAIAAVLMVAIARRRRA
jgi:hypothetical protein